jgi:hypothetical protein
MILVPRMQRSVISAFTRVFDALCGALPSRAVTGLGIRDGPGSAEQREVRCTASGTRHIHRVLGINLLVPVMWRK